MYKIAIVVVAYNRMDSLSRLLSSLDKAYYDEDVTLIISVDKSNTNVVEEYAVQYNWNHGRKIVDKHTANLGLKKHMLSLGKWFEEYDAIVVLEDDIVVAQDFYTYTSQAVTEYYLDDNIAGISLYSFRVNYLNNTPFEPIFNGYDAYFMSCAMSWGEVWLKNQWLAFYDWYKGCDEFSVLPHLPYRLCQMGKKSWLKYHTRYCIEQQKYFVFPYNSLSTTFSDKGIHNDGSNSSLYQVPLSQSKKKYYSFPLFNDVILRYDGFFENELLYDCLGLDRNELCIDINCTHSESHSKKYLLTGKCFDYKIINSYALEMRPIEQNVICGVPGDDLFLYDTTVKCKNSPTNRRSHLLYQYYMGNVIPFVRKYGLVRLAKDFFVTYIIKK